MMEQVLDKLQTAMKLLSIYVLIVEVPVLYRWVDAMQEKGYKTQKEYTRILASYFLKKRTIGPMTGLVKGALNLAAGNPYIND